ncbi:MAG: cysteine hydrolase family protein [Bacteroidota bacterium]
MKIQNLPALLLIDMQKGIAEPGYYGNERNNPNAETNARKLLDFWRAHQLPIFHIKHCSTTPSSPLVKGKVGNEFMDIVKPLESEPVFEKNVNSAFIGTDLEAVLQQQAIKKVVIVGLTTEHCISTSTRMAANLGFETYLIADAIATFDKVGRDGKTYAAQLVHEIELACLHEEFATVIDADELLEKLKTTVVKESK